MREGRGWGWGLVPRFCCWARRRGQVVLIGDGREEKRLGYLVDLLDVVRPIKRWHLTNYLPFE